MNGYLLKKSGGHPVRCAMEKQLVGSLTPALSAVVVDKRAPLLDIDQAELRPIPRIIETAWPRRLPRQEYWRKLATFKSLEVRGNPGCLSRHVAADPGCGR